MEVLGKKLTKAVSDSVSYVCMSSHALSAKNINGLEAEECNCSEQRWDDVSAHRGVSGTTIIATNYC